MLIGRQTELGEVATALGQARLVTVTGTGGVGKTTLADAALAAAPGSTLRVSLAPFRGEGLRERVAGATGHTSFDHLCDDLRNEPCLVLLDNCEHLIDEAARLTDQLLGLHPGLQVLATSREPLALPGEWVIRLRPLPADGAGSPAAELFRRAAGRHGAELVAGDAELAALCADLDGLPLALELAAARTVTMTAAEIRRHLAGTLDVLSATRRGVPERHRSLSATIAWSYRLLDGEQQRLLNGLSLVPGRFPAATAASLVDGAAHRPGLAVDLLAALVEQSLVVHEPDQHQSWYRLLDTIRSFAAERLAESGERWLAGERLVGHVVERSRELDRLGRRASEEVPRYLLGSFPTIRWAIEWTLANDVDPARVDALVAPLMWLEDVGHQAEAADVIAEVLDRWPQPRPGRGVALAILGSTQRIAGRSAAAAESARSAIACGDGLGVAYGERTLGQIARGEGRWEAAVGHFQRGAAAAWRHDNPAYGIEIGMHEGMTLARAGELAEAVAVLEDLLTTGAAYPHARAWVALFLCWVLLATDPERADRMARQELEVADEIGNAWARGVADVVLAVGALRRGEAGAAADHLRRSLAILDEMHNRTDIAMPLELGGALFVRLDRPELAVRFRATARQYTRAVLGPFERELYDSLGPIPEVPDAQPLPVSEALAHLERVAATGAGAAVVDEVPAADETPAVDTVAGDAGENRFRLEGDVWTITFGGTTVRFPASKGLADLHRLLQRPGRDLAAIDLMGVTVAEGDTGEALDRRARQEIEARIRDLQGDIDEAEATNDPRRAERAGDELDRLVDHLAAATGLGGRDRRAGATAERARSAVTARIRAAIAKLTAAHEPLGRHLERSVVTGRHCRYEPIEPTDWEL